MTDTFTLIAAQRRTVADLLESLDDAQWATPSLCAGWTVREVAAHLAMPFNVSLPKMVGRMLRARGNFDRVADNYVKVAAQQPTATLVADIRDHAEHRFTPPGAGPEAPLSDLVVHGLDIGVPVGRRPDVTDEAVTAALAFMLTKPAQRGFVPKARVEGLRFEATDTGWSGGDGPVAQGPGQSLALALAGRTALLGDLTGDGVAELTRRLS